MTASRSPDAPSLTERGLAVPRSSKLPGVGSTIFSVMSQLALETGAVNLGQGFPDFAPPEPLLDAMTRALRESASKSQYAPATGVPALREAIAEKTLQSYGRRVDAGSEVTVTSGATEAIFDCVHAVVHPGDQVIVLDPAYDCYEPAVTLAGGVTVHVPLRPKDFSVDWSLLRAAVTTKTRAIIINSPHNPSGAVWSAADLAQLAELVRDTEIVVISDEVYEHIVYDGQQHQSVLRHEELAARSFVVSSFGKTFHCTGWKVGYCIAPMELSAEFRKVHQYNTFATMTPAQWAFAAMLREHPEHARELSGFYEKKRDAFASQLRRTKFKPHAVPGGYFQLVDYSAVSSLPDVEFARELCVKHGVASIPLSPFYGNQRSDLKLVRLCFAKNDATLDAGIERLAKV